MRRGRKKKFDNRREKKVKESLEKSQQFRWNCLMGEFYQKVI